MNIRLVDVYKDSYATEFLHLLLSEREEYMNISHKHMPTYAEHVKFVESRPYKHWYLVKEYDSPILLGAIYLSKENEIGLFIKREFWGRGYGSMALLKLLATHLERPVFANIAPLNTRSQEFFKGHDFHLDRVLYNKDLEPIQYIYFKDV